MTPDLYLACCSGGGLASGTGLAMKEHFPDVQIYTVEPSVFDDMAHSLETGKREQNKTEGDTICDALMASEPGVLTFGVLNNLGAKGLVCTDEEVIEAIRQAIRYFKLVLEPGGAIALAAVLTGKVDVAGKTVVVTASGGNADPAILKRALG